MTSALPQAAGRWREFSALLDEALPLSREQRETWLDNLPQQQRVLKFDLQRVLLADARLGAREANDQRRRAGPPVPAFTPGERIGPWTLEAPLGQGGMGEVWMAHRADGAVRRTVALKLPHSWLLGGPARGWLERERDVLAALNHPNIAALFDAGITPAGQPYLVLELVEGNRIDRYANELQLPVAARLALFAQVLAAVGYAHGRLIVHRDLKPSNVLVTADGQVKLLDFGVAKLLDSGPDGEAGELTRLAGRPMTMDYAAPEQLLGREITVATDVYALGVMLFELLTGQLPFARRAVAESIVPARGADAPIASATGSSLHAARSSLTSAEALRRELRGDLDAILGKALAAEPEQRYGSVEQFAEDLRRHLRLETIHARRITGLERARRFLRRNRLAAGFSAALTVSLVAGMVGVSIAPSAFTTFFSTSSSRPIRICRPSVHTRPSALTTSSVMAWSACATIPALILTRSWNCSISVPRSTASGCSTSAMSKS